MRSILQGMYGGITGCSGECPTGSYGSTTKCGKVELLANSEDPALLLGLLEEPEVLLDIVEGLELPILG